MYWSEYKTRREPYDVAVALCLNRHQYPKEVHGYIFPEKIEDPCDFEALRAKADEYVRFVHSADDDACMDLFVSGLTQATIAVIDSCLEYKVWVNIWHYDKSADDYKLQFLHGRDDDL